MRNLVNTYLERFLHDRQQRLEFLGIFLLLALVVVGIVFWQLHYTGVAMTNEYDCGMEEHVHDKDCYELVLTCGLEETEPVPGHTHDESCYETVTTLVCEVPESEGHTHSEACFDESGNLVCTIPESEGHVHISNCYETENILICGLEETEPVSGHTHDRSCYEEVLVCEIPEHTHTIACLSDVTADVESAEDWEETLPDDLTGVWAYDVVSVAESQLGYAESERNFQLAEDGVTRNGYTRYGDFYGFPYGDWSAMFADFCLYYAGVEDVPLASGAYAWTVELKEAGLYAPAEGYTPNPGDIVFLDEDNNDRADTAAVVTAVTGTKLTVIQGDHNDAVEQYKLNINDETILGFGTLPEQPVEADAVAPPLEGGVVPEAEVSASAEAGAEPTDTSSEGVTASAEAAENDPGVSDEILTMQTIPAVILGGESELATMSAADSITISGMLPNGATVMAVPVEVEIEGMDVLAAYDITIYDGDGEEFQPEDGTIHVVMDTAAIREALKSDAELKVWHMEDPDADPEEVAVISAGADAVEFDAEHFSIYIVGEDDRLYEQDGETPHYVYTVNFYIEDMSGEPVSTQTLSPGETITVPGVPEVEHSIFQGWYTEPNGGGTRYDFTINYTLPEIDEDTELDLYAHYAKAYYIYFMSKPYGGTEEDAAVFHTECYAAGDTIDYETVEDLFRLDAYETATQAVTKWVDAGGREYTVMPQSDLTLYPVIEDAIWIYFDMNGKNTSVDPMYVLASAFAIDDLPGASCAGYKFTGWNTAEDGTGTAVTRETALDSITKNSDGSITLYAQWEPDYVSYTVNIWRQKATDGQEGLDQKEVKEDEQYSDYILYYDFGESITVSADSGTLKTGDAVTGVLGNYSSFGTVIYGDTGAYNGFEYNQSRTENEAAGVTAASDGSTVINVYYDRVTITWNLYQYSSETTASRYYLGNMVGLYGTNIDPQNESEAGGDYTYWPSASYGLNYNVWTYTDKNGDYSRITQESKFTLRNTNSPATVNYYLRAEGIYSATVYYYLQVDGNESYDVQMNGKNYVLVSQTTYHYTVNSDTWYYALLDEYSGYHVVGYALGTNSSNNYTSASSGDSAHIRSSMLSSYSNLYIYNDLNDYTITLESSGKIISMGSNGEPYYDASATETYTYPYNTDLSGLVLPTADNLSAETFGPASYYEFDGKWYVDPQLTVEFDWSEYETMPANNLVAYAGWRVKEITVTFDSNGGSEVKSQTFEANNTATEPEEPTREGYTFIGWQDENGKIFNFATVLQDDIALTAIWKDDNETTYSLTYDLNVENSNGVLDGYSGDTSVTDPNAFVEEADAEIWNVEDAFISLTADQIGMFICWNTAADGSGTSYFPDDEIEFGNADLTLYAIWAHENESTLILDHNYPEGYELNTAEGEHKTDTVTQSNLTGVDLTETSGLEHGETIAVETDSGTVIYRFDGWSSSQTNSETATDADAVIAANATVAADTVDEAAVNTLYAVWVRLDPVTVTKVVDLNGVDSYDLTNESFTFTYSVDDADDNYDQVNQTAVVAGSSLTNRNDGTYTATFTINDVATGAAVTVSETANEKYTTTYSSNSVVTESGDEGSITITMPAISAEITVTNTLNVVPVTITKVWNEIEGNEDVSHDAVTVSLLDGDGETLAEDIALSEENGWTTVVSVPEGSGSSYAVTETPVDGYISAVVESTGDDGNPVFTVTNTAGVRMPQTGGGSVLPFIITGVIVTGGAAVLLVRRKKRNDEAP